MFKAIGSVINSASTLITTTCDSVTPLAKALNNATLAVQVHSEELLLDAQFSAEQNKHQREVAMKAFTKELELLED